MPRRAGAFPSCHWEWGKVPSGQTASQSQSWHRDRKQCTLTPILTDNPDSSKDLYLLGNGWKTEAPIESPHRNAMQDSANHWTSTPLVNCDIKVSSNRKSLQQRQMGEIPLIWIKHSKMGLFRHVTCKQTCLHVYPYCHPGKVQLDKLFNIWVEIMWVYTIYTYIYICICVCVYFYNQSNSPS